MAKRKGSGGGAVLVALLIIAAIFSQFSNHDKASPRPTGNVIEPASNSSRPAAVPVALPKATSPYVELITLYTTASTLNVRAAPSTDGAILGKLSRGAQVERLAVDGEWLLVSDHDGTKGWVHGDYVSTREPVRVATQQPAPQVQAPAGPSRDSIIQLLIERSIRNYSGNCPCPYNRTASGRKCGGNSAYSRPGGRSPLCFPSDVTQAMIEAFRP